MTSSRSISYAFRLKDGDTRTIDLHLDDTTLVLIQAPEFKPPPWTMLSSNRCAECTLDEEQHQYCPTACHLSEILEMFRDLRSYDEVVVEVKDSIRSYRKETSLQDGLGSIYGLIMAAGGCPVLAPLRPMVRFHLPFASVEETEFRMISMYLVAQFLRLNKGEEADWSLEGLQLIYDRIRKVNKTFAKRIREVYVNDAGANAISILDCFATAVPVAIRNMLQEYEKHFKYYL
jgi:hypothetical protein